MKIERGTSKDADYVRKRLIEFNATHMSDSTYEEIQLCVKDENGTVIAGLNGAICWNWMEIDILWVDEKERGKRLGEQLLAEAERLARESSCTLVKLNTFSFQAPEFYKKYGYTVMAVLQNAPSGHRHYYYIKELGPTCEHSDNESGLDFFGLNEQ